MKISRGRKSLAKRENEITEHAEFVTRVAKTFCDYQEEFPNVSPSRIFQSLAEDLGCSAQYIRNICIDQNVYTPGGRIRKRRENSIYQF